MTPPRRMRIPLSAPELAGPELAGLERALASGWIAPIGPEVEAFEREFASAVGARYALATSSGTAALHLALRVLGVGPGDHVLASNLTFCASINPVLYLGGIPVLVDADPETWNVDPELVIRELERRGQAGSPPAALVLVHLYGAPLDLEPILTAASRWGVPVVEDAAEGLGSRVPLTGAPMAGTVGDLGVFSFDGSKMITTSMGGMLVSDRYEWIEHARKLARQAREPVTHYEHTEVGYNYRMSNLLAAVGRAQLPALEARVSARRRIHERYRMHLNGHPRLTFQADLPGGGGRHSRWLTALTVEPGSVRSARDQVLKALGAAGIEARPVWKPMHLQPVYQQMRLPTIGGGVSSLLFERGLCLPSSSSLSNSEVDEVCEVILGVIADD